MTDTAAASLPGDCHSTAGSNNMPTETKNSTAKASRSGSDSSAARWANSDSRIIMPAKNAPSANDTSNSLAAPKATPTAAATTHSVNSSREPVEATHHSMRGNTRRPMISMVATKASTLASVQPTVSTISCGVWASVPPWLAASKPENTGSSTSTSTMNRSSTTSQPTAMRPLAVSSRPRASSALSSTTVLATDRHSPKTSAPPADQPQL